MVNILEMKELEEHGDDILDLGVQRRRRTIVMVLEYVLPRISVLCFT